MKDIAHYFPDGFSGFSTSGTPEEHARAKEMGRAIAKVRESRGPGIALRPRNLAELVSHVAGPDMEHPRWHNESGECDQYLPHHHGYGFIVWTRGESGSEVLP